MLRVWDVVKIVFLAAVVVALFYAYAYGEEAKIRRIPITENIREEVKANLLQMTGESDMANCAIASFGIIPNGEEIILIVVCAERNKVSLKPI